MADSKLADLTAITTPATTDILYLVHDPAGTPVDRKITVANLLGASASGGILAMTTYNPASPGVSYTIGTTDADVDATNLSITFTVPSSGKVVVTLSAYAWCSTSTLKWMLRTTGGATVAGTTANIQTTISHPGRETYVIGLTGLTPGASVTYRWGARGGTSLAGGMEAGDTANVAGPATMTVEAAP